MCDADRKTLLSLLALASFVVFAAGCGKSATTGTGGTTSSSTTTQASTSSASTTASTTSASTTSVASTTSSSTGMAACDGTDPAILGFTPSNFSLSGQNVCSVQDVDIASSCTFDTESNTQDCTTKNIKFVTMDQGNNGGRSRSGSRRTSPSSRMRS